MNECRLPQKKREYQKDMVKVTRVFCLKVTDFTAKRRVPRP